MDKIPGILILIVFAVILYLLFVGWRRTRDDGEASRTKYILVWLLSASYPIFLSIYFFYLGQSEIPFPCDA